MIPFRFLHGSDLHLGRAFGGYPEGIRHRLREARHGVIARLAKAARDGGAGGGLLAGDTFDAETPAPDTLRQAFSAMGEEDDLTWVLLPGNHDSRAASELWRRIAQASVRPRRSIKPRKRIRPRLQRSKPPCALPGWMPSICSAMCCQQKAVPPA